MYNCTKLLHKGRTHVHRLFIFIATISPAACGFDMHAHVYCGRQWLLSLKSSNENSSSNPTDPKKILLFHQSLLSSSAQAGPFFALQDAPCTLAHFATSFIQALQEDSWISKAFETR